MWGAAAQRNFSRTTEDRLYVNGGFENGFQKQYPGAYAASDIYAMLSFPGNIHRPLGQMAALSISTHRDAFPVTSLASIAPRGFTQGHRTIAGSLIFNTIDRTVLAYRLKLASDGSLHTHADALPLFDILISYVNESGMLSYEQLVGVRILDYGKTSSLEQLHPVESYSYMALDYRPMRSLIAADPTESAFTLQSPINREPVSTGPPGVPNRTFDPTLGLPLAPRATEEL